MFDPTVVAFELTYPWKTGTGTFRYRKPWLTVWHHDPLRFGGQLGGGNDDSCGWYAPLYSQEDGEAMRALARQEYREIFAKQAYTAEGKDYADVGYEPSVHDAVYWSWRAIRNHFRKDDVWKYGRSPSAAELETIQLLASNPVDNLRGVFRRVTDEESFHEFFMCVYRAWRRFSRPWYRHPRWHFWHWRLQFHPWQDLRRRFWDRCCRCGKRGFPRGVAAIGSWGGDKIWHSTCDEYGTATSDQAEAKS